MICPLLLVLFSCGHVGEAKRRRSRRPDVDRGARRRADLSGVSGVIAFFQSSVRVVAADASWSVKDGVGAVGIDMDADARLDEMRPHRAFGDLELERPVGDA